MSAEGGGRKRETHLESEVSLRSALVEVEGVGRIVIETDLHHGDAENDGDE